MLVGVEVYNEKSEETNPLQDLTVYTEGASLQEKEVWAIEAAASSVE